MAPSRRAQPVLITGGGGVLARAFAVACAARGLAHHALSRNELDIADPDAVAAAVAGLRPWTVINAAAYGDVDGAEQHPTACFRANALGPAVLAEACARSGVRLVTFSSGLVFDGAQVEPYLEHHRARPLSVFGRAKAVGERLVLKGFEGAMVVRAGNFFGIDQERGLAARTLRSLERGEVVRVSGDQFVSPTYVPDLVAATLELLIDGERGVWHLANGGGVSWFEFASLAAEHANWDKGLIEPCSNVDLACRAPRPRSSVLASRRTVMLPHLEDAIARHVGR